MRVLSKRKFIALAPAVLSFGARAQTLPDDGPLVSTPFIGEGIFVSPSSGSPPPGSSATWSVTDKNANVTISGAGLIATSSLNNDVAGRGTTATTAIAAGVKRIWKVTPTIATAGGVFAGICNASETFADGAFLGGQANGAGWNATNGQVLINGIAVGSFDVGYVQGDNLYIAVDGGNMLWCGRNVAPDVLSPGVNIAALGTVFPAYGLGGFAQPNEQVTAQFAAPLGITIPVGFSVFP